MPLLGPFVPNQIHSGVLSDYVAVEEVSCYLYFPLYLSPNVCNTLNCTSFVKDKTTAPGINRLLCCSQSSHYDTGVTYRSRKAILAIEEEKRKTSLLKAKIA